MLRVGVASSAIGKEVETDPGGVPAEYCEVDAIPTRMGTKRQGHARADGLNLTQTQQAFELGELLTFRAWSWRTWRHRTPLPAATAFSMYTA